MTDPEWNELLAMIPILHTPERIAKRRDDDRKREEEMTRKRSIVR